LSESDQRGDLGLAISAPITFCIFCLPWLPFYLVSERRFPVDGMAKVGGSTFLMAALSALLCGRLSDRWICAGATPRVSAKLLWSWE